MGAETGKACRRRSKDPRFTERWMVGTAIDIGAGGDGLSKYAHLFPKLTSVREWDMPDGDAQKMIGVHDNSYDVVHSSHCLEHMRDVGEALSNWWRILKPGGHLIVVVPDFDLYEGGVFPSTYNADHKHTFTTTRGDRGFPVVGRRPWTIPDDLHWMYLPAARIQLVQLLDFTFTRDRGRFDYSTLPDAEPAIEFVVRKGEA